jgi:hypothetical protein
MKESESDTQYIYLLFTVHNMFRRRRSHKEAYVLLCPEVCYIAHLMVIFVAETCRVLWTINKYTECCAERNLFCVYLIVREQWDGPY